ncbi:MAG: hypothetical protein AUK12_04530 [Candidatus Levybacteria bacterium CG2_30_37_29]|nr:MAG: hypothetical protein AUK12_04530 [Candidatus Levybacteria bacterium CG2_30_37_29]
MDKFIIVANWKSHKTVFESIEFLQKLKSVFPDLLLNNEAPRVNARGIFSTLPNGAESAEAEISSHSSSNLSSRFSAKVDKEIVILPQFIALPACAAFAKENNLPISFGAQTVSSFPDGAYTGEVSARQVGEFASYVLLNHSERKKYFMENDTSLKEKFSQVVKNNLTPLICIQDENSFIPEGANYVVYEPPSAISTFGTGIPESREDVAKVFEKIKNISSAKLLYGGSVSDKNVNEYLGIPFLQGFLVGGASLDPETFTNLIKAC